MSRTGSIGPDTVHEHVINALDGVVCKSVWGERSYFYNPRLRFAHGAYFATVKEKDGDNDRASGLDRSGIWRLNMGVGEETFATMFGHPPARPGKGQAVEGPWDFGETDRITPHPVYGWMSWVSVLNPSTETWEKCEPLLADAHRRAVANFDRRLRDPARTGGR